MPDAYHRQNENWDFGESIPFGDSLGSVIVAHIVKFVGNKDLRASQFDFLEAKCKEIEGFKEQNIWRIVKRQSVPVNTNILGARFALTLKNHGTPDETAKDRYVLQGYNDKIKDFMVHDINTMRPASHILLIFAAAVNKFRIFCHEVT